MLNLKKGLALVLAAATAFTFAPVTSFAAAGSPASDGLTTTSGVDSIKIKSTNVQKGSTANPTYSDLFWLKEHDDSSQSGARVRAYKIIIDRKQKSDGTYEDVVLPTSYDATNKTHYTVSATAGSEDSKLAASGAATDNAPEEVTAGATNITATGSTVANTIAQRSFVILNKQAADTDNDGLLEDLGGARFYLFNAGVDGTVNVTIQSLASKDATTPLDSTTISVTVPDGATTFAIQKPEVSATEGAKIQVPFVITNPTQRPIQYLTFSDYQNTVVSVDGNITSGTLVALDSYGHFAISNTQKYGLIRLTANQQGKTTIKVHAYQDADHELTADIIVDVKPGNGKLALTYNAVVANGQTQRTTYTDNAEYRGSGNYTIVRRDSSSQYVQDGAIKVGTHARANANDVLVDNANNAIQTGKKSVDSTFNDNDRAKLIYDLDDYTVLAPVETLYADGQKTAQFSADNVAGSTVQYSLVANAESQDSVITPNGSSTKLTTIGYGTNTRFSAPVKTIENQAGDNSIAIDTTYSSYGPRTKLVWSEAAARKYGAISKDGLLTLKDGDVPSGVSLYVVVSVIPNKDQKDAGQKVSTYWVPVTLSNQQPLKFYAADSFGFVELEYEGTAAVTNLKWNDSIHNLYLSLADKGGRKSDKLNVITNVGDQYVTGYSEDTSIATYDDSTHTVTAVKEGETDIVIKTLTSPEYTGTVIAKIHVVVNKLDSTNAVSLKGVSVNKEKPTAKIAATTVVPNTTVVFDTTPYKVDKSRPTGYAPVKASDDEAGDIQISSTGNVVYLKNNGTVYVRAYAASDSKHNPSTYSYVPVNYGLNVVNTDLKVDTQPIVLDVKGTKQISATASTGTSISYTSADPTVASVDANGLVTANKSGYTTVTVAATSADGKTGDSAVITVIVKGNETIADDTVKKPSKVTGVKVTNLKGGKVKVTWTKQNQKNIKYYVKKTVGKKSAGKSVGSNKTTLSVKKGATVKVKVKAYIYDATGKKLVGSYSKTITKKTDKK